MRYMLTFNANASEILDTDAVQFARSERPNKSLKGAQLRVRPATRTDLDAVPVYSKSNDRAGLTLNENTARTLGVRASQRYELKNAGNGWYWLVPHSRVGTKARTVDGPAATVSRFEG